MKTVTNILILMIIISCNSQNNIKTNTKMKTFDIETFNKNKINNEYNFNINDSIRIEQSEWEDEYMSTIKNENSLFETLELYYKNGKLKTEIKRFYNRFVIRYKDYDKKGNVIKEEDLDKPFTYTWEDIKKYLKAHDVEDIKKQVIGISRWADEQETTWTLEFNGKYKDIKGHFVITLDGKTGEELEIKLFKGKKALGKDGTIADYEIIYKKN